MRLLVGNASLLAARDVLTLADRGRLALLSLVSLTLLDATWRCGLLQLGCGLRLAGGLESSLEGGLAGAPEVGLAGCLGRLCPCSLCLTWVRLHGFERSVVHGQG